MFSIKTTKLQEMVSKAIKGAGSNKLIPLTNLMAMQVKDNKFTIITTDGNNYLYITDDVASEDFYVVTEVDTFAKLVAKMTCESINLEIKGNLLEVRGNGTYSIALPLENGEIIKYPDPYNTSDLGTSLGTISIDVIGTILTTLKPSLAVTMENPCYTGYYVGDNVIATDTEQIAALDTKLFNIPQLISCEMMNLLNVVTDSTVDAYLSANHVILVSNHVVVYGAVLNGIESYQVDAIKGFLTQDFPSVCKLPKAELLQVLDRIALFVDVFDAGAITLDFTNDGLTISNQNMSGTELIPYLSNEAKTEFTGTVDINVLRSQVKAQAGDSITLHYGDDKSIKIKDDKVTVVMALLA